MFNGGAASTPEDDLEGPPERHVWAERRLAQLLADAEAASVEADGHEARGDVVRMRQSARAAAYRYDRIGYWLYRTQHERAGRAWACAGREYRRGLSHARAGGAEMHAIWMRDVASGKTRIMKSDYDEVTAPAVSGAT